MTTKHTPGPWRVYGNRIECGPIVAGNGWAVAIISHDLPLDQMSANTSLIASAPDLLYERDRLREINKELVAALHEIEDICSGPAITRNELAHAIAESVNAALTRADKVSAIKQYKVEDGYHSVTDRSEKGTT